jgi:SlyX protein|tara:strand:- start:3429 stop:3647 length:219 start_codon:yes stop_codon:yes gene_type:complete
MSNNLELVQRVSELEAHAAHQEGIIQDLSDGIAKQWESLDVLTRTVEMLKDQLLNLEDGVQAILPDKPPPHY